jgi:hypothetical protein
VRVRISWPNDELTAELADTPNTAVLKDVLPVEGTAKTWGEEVYFSIPVSVDLEGDARQVVDSGTVCFWGDGGPSPCRTARHRSRRPTSAGWPARATSSAPSTAIRNGLESIKGGDKVRVEHAD